MFDYSATPTDVYHASRRSRRDSGPNLAIPSVAAAVAAVLSASAAIGARESLTHLVPALAPIYAAAGFAVGEPRPAIEDVSSALATQDDAQVLTVKGRIVNDTAGPQSVPNLTISVLGADGRRIYYWVAPAPKPKLEEGESIAFTARLASPPSEGRSVAVRFAAPQDDPWSGGR